MTPSEAFTRNDSLFGGPGNDILDGGADKDTCNSGGAPTNSSAAKTRIASTPALISAYRGHAGVAGW